MRKRQFLIKFDDGTSKVIIRPRKTDLTDEEVAPLIIMAYDACYSNDPSHPFILECTPII